MIAIARAAREGHLSWRSLPHDVVAGVVVGIVAIPLAMAFAIDSGMKPEQGLFTGIVAGFLVALLGGSLVQIAGPTGAFIVILSKVCADHGPGGLMTATVLAGGILLVIGVARLGGVIRFIPHPVTVGFTAGIGVIIFTGQVAPFLGLRLVGDPRELQEFVHKVPAIARAVAAGVSGGTALVGAVALATIVAWPHLLRPLAGTPVGGVLRRVPGPLVGILAGTGLSLGLHLDGVATIGTRFGGIPSALPSFAVPDYDWHHLENLLQPAFTIAMLGAIESLLSAVVADGMSGDRHDSNQELIGQGLANLVTPFFGGFAATGAIARTATSIRNGARSPVAGLVHSAVLLLTMLVLAPYARHIPLACLAAVLVLVAWNMSEVHAVAGLLRRGSRSDRVVLAVTFLLTVFVDLVVAVEVGMVLAALLFMKHMADRVDMRPLTESSRAADPHHDLASALPPEILAYTVDGPLFFGVAHRFENTVAQVDPKVRIVILRLWRVPYLDASGINALRRAVAALRRGGRRVLLSGVHPEVRRAMEDSGVLAEVGEHEAWETLEEALACARDALAEIKMRGRDPVVTA